MPHDGELFVPIVLDILPIEDLEYKHILCIKEGAVTNMCWHILPTANAEKECDLDLSEFWI